MFLFVTPLSFKEPHFYKFVGGIGDNYVSYDLQFYRRIFIAQKRLDEVRNRIE